GRRIPVIDRVLAAFLVIDHELHRDPGVPGPSRMRRRGAVADEVARVGRRHLSSLPCLDREILRHRKGPVIRCWHDLCSTRSAFSSKPRRPSISGGSAEMNTLTVNELSPEAFAPFGTIGLPQGDGAHGGDVPL